MRSRGSALVLAAVAAASVSGCGDDPAGGVADVGVEADARDADAAADGADTNGSDAVADADVDADGAGADVDADGSGEPRWLGGDPGVAGPYSTARFEEEIPTSVQAVRTVFHLPAGASDGPYPVVIFHHGFTLRAENFEGYGQRLASHGFAVLLPSMDDGLMSPLTHAQLGEIQLELVDWIEEAAATPGSRLFGVADVGRIGVGGHSRGGKQAMLGAVSDDRLRAVLGVDPVDAGPPFEAAPEDYPSVTPDLMSTLAIPSGYIGAGRGAEAGLGGQACAPEGENYMAYFAESPTPSFAWTLPEAGHNDFVEGCEVFCAAACPRWETPEVALAFAYATAVAFFKVFLADDASYRPWLDGDRVSDQVVLEQR